MKMNKIYFSLLSLILVSLILAFNINSSKDTEAKTTGFSADWEVNENANDLTISSVGIGGVGTVSYYTVPLEDGSLEHPYGANDGPIYNSVRIPFSGYDFDYEYVSIKYEANFPVTGHNITVYCGMSEDIGTDGSDLEANDKLVGWFENWNVTSGQAKDGYKYVTINHSHYTGARTVNSIVLNFSYEGDSTKEKVIKILGITFHDTSTKPSFESDPKPFAASDFTLNDSLINDNNGTYEFDVTSGSALKMDAKYWDKSLYEMVLLDFESSECMTADAYIDGNKVSTLNIADERMSYEIPYSSDTLNSIELKFNGSGKIKLYSVSASTEPKVTNWSTSNTSYFNTIEASDDPLYQEHLVRNSNAGYPKMVISVENYRSDYDIICIDVKVVSGITLLGIQVSSDHYLQTHWSEDSFMLPGNTYHLTFNNPYSYDPSWSGDSFILYANPSSLSLAGYNYESDFYINIYFMKSSSLPSSSIEVAKDYYEYDYDGSAKSISPKSYTPSDAELKTTYINSDGKSSVTAPTVPGTYTVRFEVVGTRELRSSSKEVTLKINSLKQDTPSSGYTFDYDNGTIILEDGLEASYETGFESLISEEDKLIPGSMVYIRYKEKEGYLASDYVAVMVPNKCTEVPILTTEKVAKTAITVTSSEGVEFRIVSSSSTGEWKDSGKFVGLKKDTLYRIEARYKATETMLAGDIIVYPVRTLSDADQETTVTDEITTAPDDITTTIDNAATKESNTTAINPNEETKKSGCSSTICLSSGLFFIPAVCLFIKKRKETD